MPVVQGPATAQQRRKDSAEEHQDRKSDVESDADSDDARGDRESAIEAEELNHEVQQAILQLLLEESVHLPGRQQNDTTKQEACLQFKTGRNTWQLAA